MQILPRDTGGLAQFLKVYQIESQLAWLGGLFSTYFALIITYHSFKVNARDVEELWKDTFSYCYRY